MTTPSTTLPVTGTFPGYDWLTEPLLSFHAERVEDCHWHPLLGLLEFGPYGRSLFYQVHDPVRIATIVPPGYGGHVRRLLTELQQVHSPQERRAYLPEFPGFRSVFGVRVVPASGDMHIELPREFDDEMKKSRRPHVDLADKLTRAVSALERTRNEWDVLLILLPARWEAGFRGGEDEDFDLHDYLKAVCAHKNIPMQIVLEAGALTYKCRASVMWRLGLALYCKAGGVPWKLAYADPETAYVGLGYALRTQNSNSSDGRFVTCCSQVFDADGTGLEFIAYDTAAGNVTLEGNNPYLSRSQMLQIMSRSLQLYQNRHGGRSPRRVVVHKTTPFKPDEVEGCFDVWHASEGLDLVQVQQDVAWRGINIERAPKPSPANYPVVRGSSLSLGGRDALLWTQGDIPLEDGRHFYKEGKGIPSPLLLHRFAGHGTWEESCRAVLSLTKMNWNNDSLYDRLPVTLSYANTLAQVLKRLPQRSTRPYQFRFFM